VRYEARLVEQLKDVDFQLLSGARCARGIFTSARGAQLVSSPFQLRVGERDKLMTLLNYNHAAEFHGAFGSTIFVEANGVTHHGFGTLLISAQTYIARYEETDDQSSSVPFVTSFNSTTQGHVDISANKFLGIFIQNCTQVTYTLDVTNAETFSACLTTSVI
jgi:hypothetical protein